MTTQELINDLHTLKDCDRLMLDIIRYPSRYEAVGLKRVLGVVHEMWCDVKLQEEWWQEMGGV